MTNNVVERIYKFNEGRNPALLKLKYKAMRRDIFSFYRGTCHLFYEDFPKYLLLNVTPPVWICGDLHLENFGSYKGNNRLVYFDINDFDEAVISPASWDLVRFITSVIVASSTLKVNESESLHLCKKFIHTYTNTLAQGQARSVERETAQDLVKDLLESLKTRDRRDFLNKHTQEKKGRRRFIIDNEHIIEAPEVQQQKVRELLKSWKKSTHQDSDFFKILDIQHRIAGTGSLGTERYAILVEGKGSPDRNYLLDFKQAQNSSLQPYLTLPQPQWESQAARVIAIQQRMQGTPPALLGVIVDGTESYVLQELQPKQDKVNLSTVNGKMARLEKLMQTIGEVVAWDQLRSAGRQGSAIADDLIRFAHASDWNDQILEYARSYAIQVERDYQKFRQNS